MAIIKGPEHLPTGFTPTSKEQTVVYLQFCITIRQKPPLCATFQGKADTGQKLILFASAVADDVLEGDLAGLGPGKAKVSGDFTF